MPKQRLSDEQILTVVKQVEAGRTAAELAPEVGVSQHTIYAWKAKYGGMESNDAVKLGHLEDENGRLKRLVADLSLDLDREMLKALLIKNGLSS
jgi:putative transposase